MSAASPFAGPPDLCIACWEDYGSSRLKLKGRSKSRAGLCCSGMSEWWVEVLVLWFCHLGWSFRPTCNLFPDHDQMCLSLSSVARVFTCVLCFRFSVWLMLLCSTAHEVLHALHLLDWMARYLLVLGKVLSFDLGLICQVHLLLLLP